MSKFSYALTMLLGIAVFVAGLAMVGQSIKDESVYWLLFGFVAMFGSWRQMERAEDRRRDRR